MTNYAYFKLKADYSSPKNQIKQTIIEQNKQRDESKIVSGLPSELLAVFLLSQSNRDCELQFNSQGKFHSIQLQNIDKLGRKFADVLIGVELNEHVVTREMQLLNSQVIRARGAPLKKCAIDVLVKSYATFREWFVRSKSEKMSLRDLISAINKDNSANGKQNLNVLMQLLLLSKVELYSSQDDKILLPMSRLFTVVSSEADAQEALRSLIREARDKSESKKRGGIKSGRLMDVCKNIFVDFSGSAYERLFLAHTKMTKKGLVATGSFFRYDLSLGNAEARLCALLDMHRPYLREHNTDGSITQLTLAKTFSLNSIVALTGQTTESKKDPRRFKETCRVAASTFGAIAYSISNFSIEYQKFIDPTQKSTSEPFAENIGGDQNLLRKNSEPFAEENDKTQNLLRSFSEPFAETAPKCSTLTTTKKPLVYISNLNIVTTSIPKISDQQSEDSKPQLSEDIKKFIDSFPPVPKRREYARIRKLDSFDEYEKEIRSSPGFFNFTRKSSLKNSIASKN
ncbi:hypothetical protein [Fluviispira vulneris]|uniref:hypothetical protein n=1 Tax=Fluviispira vulneris TaxID=2763012 RepID=UPI001647E445|nr:hypothetical protein [Fluviispira vulneris]